MKFHAGEIEVQSRAGVEAEAARNGVGIHSQIALPAYYFLQQRRFAFAGFADQNSSVWCSILTGEPGFLQATPPETLAIQLNTNADPLLLRELEREQDLGLLVIDFATRRRMRFNGKAQTAEGKIMLHTREVFGNCPRYIQMRTIVEAKETLLSTQLRRASEELSSSHIELITRSDTFFIATSFQETGTDVSHRGGMPGFVRVLSPSLLAWPDYDGNKMFQTLGNLTVNSAAGLLFLDFDSGDTVQLTGTTDILWDQNSLKDFSGAQRVLRFHIKRVIVTSNAVPFTWKFLEYSPFNPQQK
jgi:uncharacterized protein